MGSDGDSDSGGARKRTRSQRSLYPGDAAGAPTELADAAGLDATQRAERAAAALSDAYSKVAQRRAARSERRTQQRQRCARMSPLPFPALG